MFEKFKSVFIVGIKGVAMANIALILKQMGVSVCCADSEDKFITDNLLIGNGISVFATFDPKVIPENTDLVLYAAAHNGSKNPQIIAAKERCIKVMHQAEFIGELMKKFKKSIAVTGCHGKTTTSSLLAYALSKLNKKPIYLVGAPTFNEHFGAAFAGDDLFVLEADEYGVEPPTDKTPKFDFFNPDYLIVTNIDFDHPDVYGSLEDTKKSFLRFMKKLNNEQSIIACADDEPLAEVLKSLLKEKYITYGFHKNADVKVFDIKSDANGISFKIKFNNKLKDSRLRVNDVIDGFKISLFGEKNVLNATAVIAMLTKLGFTEEQIKDSLVGFHGAKRRLEQLASIGDNVLFDDYAHHPAEIEATISALKQRFKNKKIVVLFQPHTFSRTAILKERFIEALSKADTALILPVFASAREQVSMTGIRSLDLMKLAKKKNIHTIYAYDSNKEAVETLRNLLSKNSVICTMGAGDIYELRDSIVKILKAVE